MTFNDDGSLRCNLCNSDPCVCGKPRDPSREAFEACRLAYTARERLNVFAHVSRVQTEEQTYDCDRSAVGFMGAGDATGNRDLGSAKPHGPVSEHFMRHYYGASKPAPTPHPDSHGHWDHAQISELLHERDVFEKRLRSIVLWLEQNQPDVFRRGIWDAIGEVGNGND